MKKIYLVPNIITTANMFFGFYSVIASIRQEFSVAAWALIGAGVCDLLDGRIARMARATSSFGIEYDSLSDLVSFGMAPALLLYQWGLHPYGRLGWLVSFLFLVAGALRLARFNVTSAHSSSPKGFFMGLPIPVAAGFVATFIIFLESISAPLDKFIQALVLMVTLGLSVLMVSRIPFPSFKEFHWKSKASRGLLLVGVLMMILVMLKPEVTFFMLIAGYVLWGLATASHHASVLNRTDVPHPPQDKAHRS